MRGTITNDELARFYVSVNADGYDRFQPPDLHTECDFKTVSEHAKTGHNRRVSQMWAPLAACSEPARSYNILTEML